MNSFQKAIAATLVVWVEVTTAFAYHVKWSVMTKMFTLTPVWGFSIVKIPGVLALEHKLLAMGRVLPYPAYLWTSNITCRFIYDERHQPPSLASRIDPEGCQAPIQWLRWPTWFWAPHMASSLYSSGTTVAILLQSHLAWSICQYRTPSHKHSFPLCLRYCFSSWDICSPTFIVSNFLFSIQVTTWFMVGSTFWALTQSATVIHAGEDCKIRELMAFHDRHKFPLGHQSLPPWPWRWPQPLLPRYSDPMGS